ncbi:hypothetical protein [Mycobacterium sp.]|uniref:hypothetical protein n=1 Tax=Mycobacterium sp. TaxID=1785 RepID=UPI003F95CFFF
MFSSNSRYATTGTYQVTLPDGTAVTVTRIPPPSAPPPIGWYRRGEAERLDVIAYQFVKDATKAWLLCDTNDAMSPDALAAHAHIGIPAPGTGR